MAKPAAVVEKRLSSLDYPNLRVINSVVTDVDTDQQVAACTGSECTDVDCAVCLAWCLPGCLYSSINSGFTTVIAPKCQPSCSHHRRTFMPVATLY